MFTLILNDLASAYKNKTVHLLVFVPMLVFFAFATLDGSDNSEIKVGLVRGMVYATGAAEMLEASNKSLRIVWLDNEAEGKRQLLNRSVDGVLAADKNGTGSATLLVIKKDSLKTFAVVENIAQLQRLAEARQRSSWISRVEGLFDHKGLQGETLPIWALMLVLMVGLLMMPAQVAEEKEKKLILGILQAPVRESEWVFAKVWAGMILTVLAVALLHVTSRVIPRDMLGYLLFLFAGSFCFAAMGTLLGLLCRSQGSARALGVIFYLPHLLPAALAGYSQLLSAVAAFVPSYYFFAPVNAILLEDASSGQFGLHLLGLIFVGASCFSAAVVLLRKRLFM